jgi:hypothetical protein
MSSVRSTVSHSGMLKNMLSQNFSELDCLRELIDDSIGARATRIRLTAQSAQNLLVVADNGVGMNRAGMDNAHVFHNRSGPSNKKHGRFGIGRKCALAVLTQLKNAVNTFSSPLEDIPKAVPGSIYELIVDFPEYIENDNIDMRATAITSVKQHIWTNYKLEGSHGTVTYIPCDPAVFKKVFDDLNSASPETSIPYILSCTYANYLSGGGSIILEIDGAETILSPVNFLNWDNIPEENRADRAVQLYLADDDEVYAYYPGRNGQGKKGMYDTDGIVGRMNFQKDSRASKFEEGGPVESFTYLGSVRIRSAYTDDWIESQRTILAQYNLEIPNRGEDGRQAVERALCGTVLSRNGKVVVRFPAERLTAGDKAKYPIAERSNHEISFEAALSDDDDEKKSLDNVFGILVNKSRVDENQIRQHVRKTIKHLQDQFVTLQYKLTIPEPEPEPAVAATTTTVAEQQALLPAPSLIVTAAEPIVATTATATATATATTDTTTIPQPAPQIRVSEHIRSTAKSRRFLLNELADLLEPLGADPVSLLREYASMESNETEEGISAHVKSLSFIKNILNNYY